MRGVRCVSGVLGLGDSGTLLCRLSRVLNRVFPPRGVTCAPMRLCTRSLVCVYLPSPQQFVCVYLPSPQQFVCVYLPIPQQFVCVYLPSPQQFVCVYLPSPQQFVCVYLPSPQQFVCVYLPSPQQFVCVYLPSPQQFVWAEGASDASVVLAYNCLPDTELAVKVELWEENIACVPGAQPLPMPPFPARVCVIAAGACAPGPGSARD